MQSPPNREASARGTARLCLPQSSVPRVTRRTRRRRTTRTEDAALRSQRGRDPPLLQGRLASAPQRRHGADQDPALHRHRVAELVAVRLDDVDLDAARIRITRGKGGKDRVVPFPQTFRETLALHIADRHKRGGAYLFESSWKKSYSTRGVRALLARYAADAGLPHNMPPHRLRHFLFTWLKTQGIDDALIQPYSGHVSRQSLEIYSRLALTDAQASYDQAIGRFPV